jgi:hypothetical protein
MALGAGLTATQVQKFKLYDSDKFKVLHSAVLQNAVAILNSGRAPTNDIQTRKAIIHAVNKAVFIEKEFAGLELPVSELLPLDAPFCNVDLTPKWSYDLDKARILNCPVKAVTADVVKVQVKVLSDGAVAGLVILGVALVLLAAFVIYMIRREKVGEPVFQSLEEPKSVQGKKPEYKVVNQVDVVEQSIFVKSAGN